MSKRNPFDVARRVARAIGYGLFWGVVGVYWIGMTVLFCVSTDTGWWGIILLPLYVAGLLLAVFIVCVGIAALCMWAGDIWTNAARRWEQKHVLDAEQV